MFFGWLSDKIGRKPIILAGCAIAALTYFPIFAKLTQHANPALYKAQQTIPVVITADPAECHFQFNPTGTARLHVVLRHRGKQVLACLSIPYRTGRTRRPGTVATIRAGTGTTCRPSMRPRRAPGAAAARRSSTATSAPRWQSAGYPPAANPSVIKMSGPFDICDQQTVLHRSGC